MTADAADWASRIAERLPAPDVRQLARAAAGGQDGRPAGSAGRPPHPSCGTPAISSWPGSSGEDAYLAGLLAGAARAVERARQHQSIDVVWTGPESGITTGRLTAAAVTELIGQARREILLVSYATQTEPAIDAALTDAASHGVEITLLAEHPADNPAYSAQGTPFPKLPATRLRWPASQRRPGRRCTPRSSSSMTRSRSSPAPTSPAGPWKPTSNAASSSAAARSPAASATTSQDSAPTGTCASKRPKGGETMPGRQVEDRVGVPSTHLSIIRRLDAANLIDLAELYARCPPLAGAGNRGHGSGGKCHAVRSAADQPDVETPRGHRHGSN